MAAEEILHSSGEGEDREQQESVSDRLMAEPIPEEDEDSTTLVDRLKGVRDGVIDNKGWVAAAIVGTGAITAAAVIAKRKGWLRTPEGNWLSVVTDRHSPDTVSVVEIPAKGDVTAGIAASFPVSAHAAGRLVDNREKRFKDIFALRRREFAYPLRDSESKDNPLYKEATQRVAGWLVNALSSKDSKEEK
jgi:hypothetical protein